MLIIKFDNLFNFSETKNTIPVKTIKANNNCSSLLLGLSNAGKKTMYIYTTKQMSTQNSF